MGYKFFDEKYDEFLQHSFKGTTWKKGHKYIRIENGRYIYDEKKADEAINKVKEDAEKKIAALDEKIDKKFDQIQRAQERMKYWDSATPETLPISVGGEAMSDKDWHSFVYAAYKHAQEEKEEAQRELYNLKQEKAKIEKALI